VTADVARYASGQRAREGDVVFHVRKHFTSIVTWISGTGIGGRPKGAPWPEDNECIGEVHEFRLEQRGPRNHLMLDNSKSPT
jgi:hypothetical protein